MKTKLLFFALAAMMLSCETDDNAGGDSTNFSYFPLQVQNSWDYDVTTDNNTERDGLEVASQNQDSYTLSATPTPPNAFMTNILSSGTLRQVDGKLLGSGAINFGFQGANDLEVVITDGPLYDQNASPGRELLSVSDQTTQNVQGYDLDVNYTVRTVQQAGQASMVVNGITYSEVIHSQVIVNASISTQVTVAGFTTTVSIMNAQDVIVMDNYWARDIGLIRSDNQLDYQLEDFTALGVSLPVAQSASVFTEQRLTAYMLN